MEIKAHLNYLRISPRKVRLLANAVKGFSVKEASAQLNILVKRSSDPIAKLVKSAAANAKHNFNIDESNLYVSSILVNEGPSLKRWMPRAQGRATEIIKRTSHITVILDEINPKDNYEAGNKESQKEIKEIGEIKEIKKTSKKTFGQARNNQKTIKGSQDVDAKKKFQRRKAI